MRKNVHEAYKRAISFRRRLEIGENTDEDDERGVREGDEHDEYQPSGSAFSDIQHHHHHHHQTNHARYSIAGAPVDDSEATMTVDESHYDEDCFDDDDDEDDDEDDEEDDVEGRGEQKHETLRRHRDNDVGEHNRDDTESLRTCPFFDDNKEGDSNSSSSIKEDAGEHSKNGGGDSTCNGHVDDEDDDVTPSANDGGSNKDDNTVSS